LGKGETVMRFVDTIQIKREGKFFTVAGRQIPALRKSTPGYGVLFVFEAPTKVDYDFRQVLNERCGRNTYGWFPTASQLLEFLKIANEQLRLSDKLTVGLRDGKDFQLEGDRAKLENFM